MGRIRFNRDCQMWLFPWELQILGWVLAVIGGWLIGVIW